MQEDISDATDAVLMFHAMRCVGQEIGREYERRLMLALLLGDPDPSPEDATLPE